MSMPISMQNQEDAAGRKFVILGAVLGLHVAAFTMLSFEPRLAEKASDTPISVVFLEKAPAVSEQSFAVLPPAAGQPTKIEETPVALSSPVTKATAVEKAAPRTAKKPVATKVESKTLPVESVPALEAPPVSFPVVTDASAAITNPAPSEIPAPASSAVAMAANTGEGTNSASPAREPGNEEPMVPVVYDAEYLKNPKPVYSRKARLLRHEGLVVLRVLVSALGTAQEVLVKTSSGSSYIDESAVDTLKKWKFIPARRGNTPLDSWVLVPINFKLD